MFLWIRDELETGIGSSRPQQTWVQEEAGIEWMDGWVDECFCEFELLKEYSCQ